MEKPKQTESSVELDKELADAGGILQTEFLKFTQQEAGAEEAEESANEVAGPAEAASPDPSKSVSDVKETVTSEEEADEEGVPYKNRYFETKRKFDRLEEQMQQIMEKLDNQPQSMTTSGNPLDEIRSAMTAPTPPPPQTGGDWDEPATRQDAVRFASLIVAKERNDALALQKFPELANPGSLLARETIKRAQMKKQMGYNPNDPMFVYETAAAVYGDLVASGKISTRSKAADEAKRQSSVAASTPSVKPQAAPKKSDTQITAMDKFVLQGFKNFGGAKISTEEFLKLKKRRG